MLRSRHGNTDNGAGTATPGPRGPKTAQGIALLIAQHGAVTAMARRYGSTFTIDLPIFAQTVVISEAAQLKDLSGTSRYLLGRTKTFKPDRFVGAMPNPFAWIAFGGGMNRCFGAAFANMEMDVTLRTLLREFRFAPTDEPGERRHNRGVTIAPGRGGRAVVYRRTADASNDADSVPVADHSSRRLEKRVSWQRAV
jgi:hypothetical protein